MSEWIKVADRVPKDGQAVFCCNQKMKVNVPIIASYEKKTNGFWSLSTWQNILVDATYWMEIPELPK